MLDDSRGDDPLIIAILLAWIPLTVVLFRKKGRRAGTLASVILGYLFLPWGVIPLPEPFRFLLIEKQTIIGASLLVAMYLVDREGLRRFRPSWWDLPFVALIALAGLVSVLGRHSADLVDDRVLKMRLWWIVPYVAGRMYCDNPEGARRIAGGLVLGTLALVPIVAFEALAGPSWYLRKLIYGVPAHEAMASRLGGWRPEAFFGNGIELASWFALATVLAVWLWLSGSWRPRLGPRWLPSLALLATTLACRGVYGYIDLSVGLVVALLSLAWRTRLMLLALGLATPAYLVARCSGAWSGADLVRLAEFTGRASSVALRLAGEDQAIQFVRRANPWFGLGRPLGSPPVGEWVPTGGSLDGGWLTFLWFGGFVGVGLYCLQLLGPAFLALSQPGRRPRPGEMESPVLGLVLFTLLFLFDGLHNTPLDIAAALVCGSLVGLTITERARGGGGSGNGAEESTRTEGNEAGHRSYSVRSTTAAPSRASTPSPAASPSPLAAVGMVAGLACLLYVLDHARVEGHEFAKSVGAMASPLMFSAVGAFAAWSATRRVPLARLATFFLAFGVLGISFNVALHPRYRPALIANVLQGLAMAGLGVALWRRAVRHRVWADAFLIPIPILIHFAPRPDLSAIPGSWYFVTAPDGSDALFQLCPWLTFAVLGAWAWSESLGVTLLASVLLAAGAFGSWWTAPVGFAPMKFPVNLPLVLLASTAITAAFALARGLASRGMGQGLSRLGCHWPLFFYAHFAFVMGIAEIDKGRAAAFLIWTAIAVASVIATTITALLFRPVKWVFLAPLPWCLCLLATVVAWNWPRDDPWFVSGLAGVTGIVFATNWRELARLLAGPNLGLLESDVSAEGWDTRSAWSRVAASARSRVESAADHPEAASWTSRGGSAWIEPPEPSWTRRTRQDERQSPLVRLGRLLAIGTLLLIPEAVRLVERALLPQRPPRAHATLPLARPSGDLQAPAQAAAPPPAP